MASTIGTIAITDCSRGLSDWFPPRLEDDQLVDAVNVEFWDGAVCGRRNGTLARVSTGVGIFTTAAPNGLAVHTPTPAATDDRLAALYHDNAAGVGQLVLYTHAWLTGATFPALIDAMDVRLGVDMVSLHGKLFIACNSAVDRLHVWDGAEVRRTGLAAPDPPVSVANLGSGTFTGTRQYRLRVSGTSAAGVLRSEPSTPVSFTPSGSGAAARITLPVYGHPVPSPAYYQLEELAPNGSWYALGFDVITAPFIDDTIQTPALVPTAPGATLAPDIGDNALQYSAKYLTVDEDRLLLGGAWEQPALSARVSWTPLGSAVGDGNDERLPFDVQGFIDFDTLDGGPLTGIKAWEGKVLVFKRQQVHQMVRTSSRLRAYLPDCLSRRHGAIPYSIVEGTDVDGLSCLYFLDPDVGPMQLGMRGLRVLAPEMQRTWRSRVNLLASQVASVTYHPEKRQVWWHVATDGATAPTLRWMYSVESDGLVFHTLMQPVAGAAPWNGKPALLSSATAEFGRILVSGDEPTVTTDVGAPFRASITTKAYQMGGLMRRFQIGSAVIEASSYDGTIAVTCIRDFGLERRRVEVSLAPVGSEAFVSKPLDDCYLSEAISMQFEIGDPEDVLVAMPASDQPTPLPAFSTTWQIHSVVFAYTLGSPSTGRG